MIIKKLLTVLVCSSLSYGFDIDIEPSLKWNKFIAGGSEPQRDQFLYKCALYIARTTEENLNFCSGSIITEKFVLSAAHCFLNLESGILIAGVHNLQEEAPYDWDFEPSDVIVHEQFNASINLNDIALINATKSPFNFIPGAIQKIQIASASISVDNLIGRLAKISGWGRTSDSVLEISNTLQFIETHILSTERCRLIYGNRVTSNNLCLSGENGQSTCQGDSGSAMQVTLNDASIIVGIVSFGAEAGCQFNYPTVFTFIAPYYNWITSKVGQKLN